MKRSFFQVAVVSILLYGCTTWTLTKRLEKKLDGNYTRMLRAILNRSWQQHPTRRQLYGHLPPITKTIQARRTRHAGHCWRSKDEIVSDELLWTPAYGQSKAGRPARTYIQQLCDDTGCNPEVLPEAINDRETWRERVRDIRASRTSWWWWYDIKYYYCFIPCGFFNHHQLVVFRLILSDSKSPQVIKTLHNIPENLNIADVWIVSIRPLMYNSYFPFQGFENRSKRANYNWYYLSKFMKWRLINLSLRIFGLLTSCPARTNSAVDRPFGWNMFLSGIVYGLRVRSHLMVGITWNNFYNLALVPSHG